MYKPKRSIRSFLMRYGLVTFSASQRRGAGGWEHGKIGAGGVRESGEERAGCGSSKSVGSGREMQNSTCFHLLMCNNTLKTRTQMLSDLHYQSSKLKFALELKNRLTSCEIVNPFTMVAS